MLLLEKKEGLHILFGVTGLDDHSASTLVGQLKEKEVLVAEYSCRYKKIGVRQYLDTHPDTDIVVLSEVLEWSSPFTKSDFEDMVENYENVLFIPILQDSHEGKQMVKDLYNLCILNALFNSDGEIENLASLIRRNRTRKEAKSYYSLQNVEENVNEADISSCVAYICEADPDSVVNAAIHIFKFVKPAEFQKVLNVLPDDKLSILKSCGEEMFAPFLHPQGRMEKESKKSGVSELLRKMINVKGCENEPRPLRMPVIKKSKAETNVVEPSISESTISQNSIKEEKKTTFGTSEKTTLELPITTMEKKQSEHTGGNAIKIGVSGTKRGAGATFQAITIAHLLAGNGYKVALLEMGVTHAFESIEKEKEKESESVNEGIFHFCGVTYYKKVTEERIPFKGYDFLVFDYGFFGPRIREGFINCKERFLITGCMPWDSGPLKSIIHEFHNDREIHVLVRGHNTEEINDILPMMYGEADIINSPFSSNGYPALHLALSKYLINHVTQKKPKIKQMSANNLIEKDKPCMQLDDTSAINEIDQIKTEKQVRLWGSRQKQEHSIFGKKGKKLYGICSVFVTSLKSGCGCTHVSVTAANYLLSRGSSCLVSESEDVETVLSSRVDLEKDMYNMDEAYGSHDSIVIDGGVFQELDDKGKAESKRCLYRFMICWGDSAYKKKLAKFVEQEGEDAENWIYVFNNIPEDQIKDIKKLMNLYNCCFLPTYSAESIPYEVERICQAVFH